MNICHKCNRYRGVELVRFKTGDTRSLCGWCYVYIFQGELDNAQQQNEIKRLLGIPVDEEQSE